MREINTVLVLGAGVMGRAIAQHLACAGIETTVFSRTRRTLDTCRGQIRDSLATLAGQGLATEADNAAALSRIAYVTDMAEPATNADTVIETVSENLPLKQKVFRELDRLCPAGTILATNTSSFDINEIASAAVNGPERVLGMHWFHPPNITPGIEIIPGAATAPGVVEALEAFCLAVDKVPTRCANTPGFVANRIQMAMAAEALKIVAEKLATPEEVDRIIRSTIGFRLGAFGPFEIADMAGTDTYLAIMHYMREKLGWDNGRAIDLLTAYTDRGRFGLKAGAGFYDYDEASAARVLKLRDEFLSRRLALFNEENSERNPMNISLGYGKGTLQTAIDDVFVDAVLTPNDVPVPDDESRLILSALRHPIGTGTIDRTFGPGQSVCIVTSDITRPCPSYKLLPPLLEELGEAGVKNDDITIVFATGAHRRHTREEIEHLVGNDIASRYRCIDMDPEDVVLVGVSTRGTPFEVFRPVAEASRRICLGNIEYHYFAGYSGGIKAIVPGVCSRRTIQANHAFMVDEKAATGNLVDNPVRDDLEALLEFLPVDLILNVVLAPDKTVLHAVAGDCIKAHRAGCAFLDTLYRFPLKKAADIVLVTPGGFPKDLNIYQAQKALDNARYAVRQGSAIIWVAACPEGYGSEVFETWLNEADSPDDLIERVKARFELGGHKAAAIAMTEKKADVYMVSELEDAVMENMFVTPCPDVETALAKARARLGKDASIVIMPFGGSTLPAVEPAP